MRTSFNELTFAYHGREYCCRKYRQPCAPVGEHGVVKAHWVVEIDNLLFLAFDAEDGETEEQVMRGVIMWDARGRIPERSK